MAKASLGTFVLHRFNGEEVYRLAQPTIEAYRDEDGVTLCLEAKTAEALRMLPDTEPLRARPRATLQICLPALDASSLVGRRFNVPRGSDEDSDDSVASIYYCEHEDLDENEVDVVSRFENTFQIYWTGSTVDVNFYDGSKPPTRIEIHGFFRFIGMAEWMSTSQDS